MPNPVIVFDVNETLLDMSVLEQPFERVFGDKSVRSDWFKQLLQLSLLANVLDSYSDFVTLGRAALEMVAIQRRSSPSDEQKREILDMMKSLPPHNDVPGSLERLRMAGFRLATLTNSTAEMAETQLRNAGIRAYFETAISVDSVRRYKPAPETYRMAATQLGIPVSEMLLVAAHGWDVWGAMHAGASAAFVARPGQVLIPLAPTPDIVGSSMVEVVDGISARYVEERHT